MTYTAQDESLESGQPIELFRFMNVEEQFNFTSGQEPVIFNGRTYTPEAIERTQPSVASLEVQRNIAVKMPITNAFARRYIATVPASPDTVTIYRFHTTDTPTPEVIVLFTGAVASVQFEGDQATATVQGRSAVLGRTIPRQSSRANCNHILYDVRCAVNDSLFKIGGLVTAISADGFLVQLSTGSNTVPNTGFQLSAQLSADSAFFNAGFIRRGGIEHRMVQSITDLGGNVASIAVILPFQTISVGNNLDLFAGCDHQLSTCIDKFDNVDRYGGFPFIPEKNPFTVGVKQ